MLLLAALVTLAGCAKDPPSLVELGTTPDSRRVLVVMNDTSDASAEVADYYVSRRHIPHTNVVRIRCRAVEEVSDEEFRADIKSPVMAAIRANPNRIDFIVLTKGVPIRMSDDQHYSVDAWLAAGDLPIKPIGKLTAEALKGSGNPYFGADEPFSSRKYGFYLVTRLDGYSVEDCKDLVDHSIAARAEKGPFLLDEAENRKDPQYEPIQSGLARAASWLRDRGMDVELETTRAFVAPDEKLAGYASWGSNDAAFDLNTYRRLRFKPGALCETFVSTSGRTFSPTQGGQSLIADLIHQGVTGVKGYVSEPFTFALAHPEILFARYVSGRNLAESFYSASQFLKWKDVVIGDPLCAPYRG